MSKRSLFLLVSNDRVLLTVLYWGSNTTTNKHFLSFGGNDIVVDQILTL